MRRLCLIVGVLGSLLVGVAPAAAAGIQNHLTFRGSGADASFAGLSPGEVPVPGVVYTDTSIYAADDATQSDGTRYRDGTVSLSQFSYRYDEHGGLVPVAYAYGTAHGRAVELKVTGDLGTASAAAQVPMTRCEIDAFTWLTTCSDGGSRLVSAVWAGTGELIRGMSRWTWSSGGSHYISQSTGAWRPADPTATVDGSDLGHSSSGSIFRVSGLSVDICHGC